MKKHTLAICFTNFGPYHLARLSALGEALASTGGHLLAYEMAGSEAKYPWQAGELGKTGITHVRLFPGRTLESLSSRECRAAMLSQLDRDQPTAIAAVGYSRPESMAMLGWAKANGALRILLSESQKKDLPRVWWKEAIKSRRVRQFQAGLVGGETHREYLAELGLESGRIHLGYNAVGNAEIEQMAARAAENSLDQSPQPYFLSVCRFAPEKNLAALIHAYREYVRTCNQSAPWRLVLAGDGPLRSELIALTKACGVDHLVSWPGFLTLNDLVPLYTACGAFVLPSLSEPWGLVANEAALCAAPLLLSDRCGATGTFLPRGGFPAGWSFDPEDVSGLSGMLIRVSNLPENARRVMGETARRIARQWGPERFATGLLAAIESAETVVKPKMAWKI